MPLAKRKQTFSSCLERNVFISAEEAKLSDRLEVLNLLGKSSKHSRNLGSVIYCKSHHSKFTDVMVTEEQRLTFLHSIEALQTKARYLQGGLDS